MKQESNWNDLKLFLAVARTDSLNQAAAISGASAPTLSRRIRALERQIGQNLFLRDKTGFQLSAAGSELLDHCMDLEAAIAAIDRWQEGQQHSSTVRISAGSWTSRHLARNHAALSAPDDRFRIEFAASEVRIDIGRHAADIGIRNHRPEEAWLAGRRIGRVAFCSYALKNRQPGWIAVTGGQVQTPSEQWVVAHHSGDVLVRASSPWCALELALSGAGTVVLPCFVGDRENKLIRTGDPITALEHEQWLVAHHDERNRPEIRTVIRRIAEVLKRDRDLFAGSAA